MRKETLKIEGMYCNSCAQLIEGVLEDAGVTAIVDFNKKIAKITYDEEKINIGEIIAIIRKEGYKV